MDTEHANHAFISSDDVDDVEGAEVYDKNRRTIGEIDYLIIDKASGRILYAVLCLDGFLGIGHSHVPLAWTKLSYDITLRGFRTGASQLLLRKLPASGHESLESRDLEQRAQSQNGLMPHWGQWAPIS